jgi:pimeloyl-ACP methyl ester carboxylesterase
MKTLLRSDWFARILERRSARHLEAAARRSIRDRTLCTETLAHPENGALFRELLSSTTNRLSLRLAGTDNDIAVTRTSAYELERILAPCLIVHGTIDSVVSFEHAKSAAKRIAHAELVAIENGEHVALFTHRDEVRARVTAFLRTHLGETAIA